MEEVQGITPFATPLKQRTWPNVPVVANFLPQPEVAKHAEPVESMRITDGRMKSQGECPATHPYHEGSPAPNRSGRYGCSKENCLLGQFATQEPAREPQEPVS